MQAITQVAEGQLPFNPAHENTQLVPMLGNRILRVNRETGGYKVWQLTEAGDWVAKAEGQTAYFGDRLVIWIGGNLFFTWSKAKSSFLWVMESHGSWEIRREHQLRARLPFAPEWLQYVGRGRILAGQEGRVCLVKADLRLTMLRGRIEELEDLAKERSLVWAGGFRILAHAKMLPQFVIRKAEVEPPVYVRPPIEFQPYPTDPGQTGAPPMLAYMGNNRMAFLFAEGRYEVHEVLPQIRMDLEIEDYLEIHPKVRRALAWPLEDRVVRYTDWDTRPETDRFYSKLKRFREQISDGGDMEFSFEEEYEEQTTDLRVAPYQVHQVIKPRDAAELYLAQVAHSLSIEMSGGTEWRLHDYGLADLDRLLNGAKMFIPAANEWFAGYSLIENGNGRGMPTDPRACWSFLKGWYTAQDCPLILSSSRQQTIKNLMVWMRDHLCHANPGNTQWHLAAYGYRFQAPISKMLIRLGQPEGDPPAVPPTASMRYWSWHGCHSAGALLVWILRAANIPSESPNTHIADDTDLGQHHGFDCPVEGIFLGHTDDLYETPETKDPNIDPFALCDTGDDYETEKTKWMTEVTAGDARAVAYDLSVTRKAMPAPTAYWVYLYIMGQAAGEVTYNRGFEQADAAQIYLASVDNLEAAKEQFCQENDIVGADRSVVGPEYWAQYEAWKASR